MSTVKSAAEKRMKELYRLIKDYNYRYYVENNPVASDSEYDALYAELVRLEKNFPRYREDDSPTQRVGGEPVKDFRTVTHAVPMLSIENTYSEEELREFDERVRKATGLGLDTVDYVVELKIDGAAVSLTYENGRFVLGATRGDGRQGDDITANLKTIRTLPLVIDFKEPLEVRGEVYLRKDELEKINREREKNGEPLFANTRNAAAGSLKLLDPRTVSARNLQLFVYTGLMPHRPATHWDTLDLLRKLGFPVNPDRKRIRGIEEVIAYCAGWRMERFSLPYGTDGLVIKVNSLDAEEILGATSKNPRWMTAYKFPAEQVTTVVERVEFQVGRTGVLTPVAHLAPVEIGGTTVARATLHNIDEIRRLGLKTGDRVFVEKGGEVIPKIVKAIAEARTGSEKEIPAPAECPVCGSRVVRDEEEVALRCPNVRCPAQIKERIAHFASRDAMDIEGLGWKWVDILVEKNILTDYGDIYQLPSRHEELVAFDRMGEKSVRNLAVAIERSKRRPLAALIFALGIPQVGVRSGEILALRFKSLDALEKATADELTAVREIGEVTAEGIVGFFADPSNRAVIEKLRAAGVNMRLLPDEIPPEGSPLEGKSFVITGTLERLSREEAAALIKRRGGRVIGTISRKTDYLVCGKDPGSKLKKAETLGVKVIDEKAFEKLLK